MRLASLVFTHMGEIPTKYTCDGADISPPLEWNEVPSSAKSLALIMIDPDIPQMAKDKFRIEVWDHWVVFNIPPQTRHLIEGKNPPGTLGKNTSGDCGYDSPCPPDREHRYFFTLYALDCLLELHAGATRAEVEKAMQGHIIEQTELMGRYVRSTLK